MTSRNRAEICSRSLLLGIMLVAAPGPAAPEIPLVANGDMPTEGLITVTLEELWRIGGLDDEENLLGVIDRAVGDDDGNLYLLDIQLTEAQVYGPDGVFLRTLGQAGDGPGELRRASDLLLLPDGTVGLVQAFPGRIVKVDREGLPAGELRPGGSDPAAGGFFALRGAAVAAGRLICSGSRMSRGETTRQARHFISAFGDDGHEDIAFHEASTEFEMGRSTVREIDDFFPHAGGWAALPDGRVVVAPLRNEYRLEIHAPDGSLERVATRRYESWRRTANEKSAAESRLDRFRRRNRNRPEFVVEPTEKDILRIQPMGDGFWVLPSRGVRRQAEGVHSTWDVFDGQGGFVRQVALGCDADGLRDEIFFPGGDLVVIVREHADAMRAFRGQAARDDADEDETDTNPLEVVVYRMSS